MDAKRSTATAYAVATEHRDEMYDRALDGIVGGAQRLLKESTWECPAEDMYMTMRITKLPPRYGSNSLDAKHSSSHM